MQAVTPVKLAFACMMIGLLAMPAAWAQSVAGRAPATSTLPATIPIFPLEDVVLFPDMSVPLHIYEPRYRAMLADALKSNRMIGMVLLRPGYEADYERSPSVFPIGCAGVLTEVRTMPNGESDIVLKAVTKFRIEREEASTPYRVARVTAIPETTTQPEALHTQRQRLDTLLASSGSGAGLGSIPQGLSDEELVNGVAQYVSIDALDRQKLLEQEGALSRALALIELFQK